MTGAQRVRDYFGISQAKTTIGKEIRAGFVTFLTMSYILFVNPDILSQAIQVPNAFPQLLTATALAAAFGSLIMGILGRYPYALAPGMGLNAYFTYTVVIGAGVPWQTALGAVFISGLVFLVVSLSGLRARLIEAIPPPIKAAITAGIGCFLAMIGMQNAGLVIDHPATLVTLGSPRSAGVIIALVVLLLVAVLQIRKVKGAILIGILGGTLIAILTGAPVYNGEPFGGFHEGFIRAPVWPSDLVFALDLTAALELGALSIIFTFLFVDFFDTAGTLIGLSEKAGKVLHAGERRGGVAFGADAMATSLGALVGTSTTTCYIESAAGIEEGGRTGLVAVTVAVLFLASMFFWPIAAAVPAVVTAPILIIVGAMMMQSVRNIAWQSPEEAVPALLIVLGMPLTFSITDGLSLGLIAYAAFQLFSGRLNRSNGLLYVLATLLVLRYVFLMN